MVLCCQSAIEICRHNGLSCKEACIHGQLFELFVRYDLNRALKAAEDAIHADPNYELVSSPLYTICDCMFNDPAYIQGWHYIIGSCRYILMFLLQGYYYRAQGHRMVAESVRLLVPVARSHYTRCVEDYIQCFRLSQNVSRISRAIVIATDHGMITIKGGYTINASVFSINAQILVKWPLIICSKLQKFVICIQLLAINLITQQM